MTQVLLSTPPLLVVLFCSCVGAVWSLSPLEAQSMRAHVLIQSGVEFHAADGHAPEIASVQAKLTSVPRESFHQSVHPHSWHVSGSPPPDSIKRQDKNDMVNANDNDTTNAEPIANDNDNDSIVLLWKDLEATACHFELSAEVDTSADILPITQQIPFPLAEDSIPRNIREEYTLPTPTVQSEDPEIHELAHKIWQATPQKDDLYHVVFALADWVRTNIHYGTTPRQSHSHSHSQRRSTSTSATTAAPTCQSALETLHRGIGKCDELSALFIALARSLGIPARFVTGCAYTNQQQQQQQHASSSSQNNAFGMHAWAECWFPTTTTKSNSNSNDNNNQNTPTWIPLDVAYGQYGHVTAGHITLSTAADVAVDASNVQYQAKANADFVMEPQDIDVQVQPIHLEEPQKTVNGHFRNKDVLVTLEPSNRRMKAAARGQVIELLCTLQNPHNHYVCTHFDVAETQDATFLPDNESTASSSNKVPYENLRNHNRAVHQSSPDANAISNKNDRRMHVLLNPRETKEIPLRFEINPNLSPGYTYHFPFSVICDNHLEAETTIVVGDETHQAHPWGIDDRLPEARKKTSEQSQSRTATLQAMHNSGGGSGSPYERKPHPWGIKTRGNRSSPFDQSNDEYRDDNDQYDDEMMYEDDGDWNDRRAPAGEELYDDYYEDEEPMDDYDRRQNRNNIYDPTGRPSDLLDQARYNDNQFTDAAPAWQQSGRRNDDRGGYYAPSPRRRARAGSQPPPTNQRREYNDVDRMDRGAANIYDPTNHPYKDRMEQARRNDNQFTDSSVPSGPWEQATRPSSGARPFPSPRRRRSPAGSQPPIKNYRPTRSRGQNIYDPTSRPYGDRLDQARHNDNQFTDASPAWQQQSSGYDDEEEGDFYSGPNNERRAGNSSPTCLFDRLPKQRKTDYGPEQTFGSGSGSQAEWQETEFMNRERRRQEYYDDDDMGYEEGDEYY